MTKAAKTKVTLEYAKSVLDYDPVTGVFVWKDRPRQKDFHRGLIGKPAGWNSAGYIRIQIENQSIMAHRLAWFFMTGCDPENKVDHRNLLRHDNRWSNLRLATDGENARNAPARKRNTSGFKGVSLFKQSGKWKAQIQSDRKTYHLGLFLTPEEAHAAYAEAAARLHGEFARAA